MQRPVPEVPGPGQESVWDYPRPPRLEVTSEHVVVRLGDAVVAETRRPLRVLETSHPPTYYVPRDDVDTALLAVLGIDPTRIPLWLAARQGGITGTVLTDLTFPLLTPAQCEVNDFMIPEELSPVRFNPFRFVKNSLKRVLLHRIAS